MPPLLQPPVGQLRTSSFLAPRGSQDSETLALGTKLFLNVPVVSFPSSSRLSHSFTGTFWITSQIQYPTIKACFREGLTKDNKVGQRALLTFFRTVLWDLRASPLIAVGCSWHVHAIWQQRLPQLWEPTMLSNISKCLKKGKTDPTKNHSNALFLPFYR